MKFCPHCGANIERHLAAEAGQITAPQSATGSASSPTDANKASYDQTQFWRALMKRVRESSGEGPAVGPLVDGALKKGFQFPLDGTGLDTIVHLVFDRKIVPDGGILHRAVLFDGKQSPSVEHMQAQGYLVTDGKLALVDDMPVGEAYGVLDYWGGEKQCARWHLTKPVTINPSRNGNPFYMDEEMIAFGARWRDDLKMRDGLLALLMMFRDGVKGDKPVAIPLALEIVQIAVS